MSIRNIRNLIVGAVVTAALSAGATSCLDKMPGSAIPEGEAMKTFAEAEQTLTGIYSALMSSALYGGTLTLCPDIQADMVYAVDGYSNTYGDFWMWTLLGNDTYVESVYEALYMVIGRCNFFLERVGEVRANTWDDDMIEVLDAYTGEVYCARALAYSELIKLFCKDYRSDDEAKEELGVVLRTDWSKNETAVRSSLYDSYRQVLDDLERAESLLDGDDDVYGSYYLTLAAAQALHARVALYMRDWDTAIEYASKVIGNREFELSNTSPVAPNVTYFEYMWTYDLGYEIIWNLGYTYTNYGSATGTVFLHYNNDFVYFYPDYVPASWVVSLYGSNDIRRYAYFSDGTEQIGYGYTLPVPLLTKYFGNIEFIQNYRLYHVNMPKVFRLAEQYLIRAEAWCRSETQKNFSRAGEDLTTLRNARMTSGAGVNVTESNWQQMIEEERVRELYMEGFRLQDLKRWEWKNGFERTHQANAVASGSSMKIAGDNPLFVWPIPRHELESPGSQVQPNDSNR